MIGEENKLPVYIINPVVNVMTLFTHQQIHYLLNLERFKIYTRIHINIASTCFGLRPTSGSWYCAWLMQC
jgi:hypothetical protein